MDHTGAIRLDPKNATAFHGRARVWAAKADYNRSLADFHEFMRLDPKNANPHERHAGASFMIQRVWMRFLCGGAGIGALAGLVFLLIGVIERRMSLTIGGLMACVVGSLIAGIVWRSEQ